MFYFYIKVLLSILIILYTYYLFSKKEISILEIIFLLLIYNSCIYLINNNQSLISIIFISLLIIISYYLYTFLYNKSISNKVIEDKILINRGLINFNELIKEKISYNNLIYELKKKGINNPNLVDYCIKKNNELIIFRKNTIKNYPISIIIDGFILDDNLVSINKTIEWLNKKIDDNNLILKDINYAYYKNSNIYFITNSK